MIIHIDDWKFHAFSVSNRRFYAQKLEDHCDCAWCRNFYQSVDSAYPDLRPFLEQFGVHLNAPSEMIAFSPTLCTCYYVVCGDILEQGSADIVINGITVSPLTKEEALVNTDMEGPTYFLQVGTLSLPWVLEEPMEQADSPAKGKNMIQRLLRRWIDEE